MSWKFKIGIVFFDTGWSLIIVFFPKNFVVFYLPGECKHTDTEGKQRKEYFKIFEKTQYLMHTLYYIRNICNHNILKSISVNFNLTFNSTFCSMTGSVRRSVRWSAAGSVSRSVTIFLYLLFFDIAINPIFRISSY